MIQLLCIGLAIGLAGLIADFISDHRRSLRHLRTWRRALAWRDAR